jgi:hypothetical protein
LGRFAVVWRSIPHVLRGGVEHINGDQTIRTVRRAFLEIFGKVWTVAAYAVPTVAAVDGAGEPMLALFADAVSAGRPAILRTLLHTAVPGLADVVAAYLMLAVFLAGNRVLTRLAGSVATCGSTVLRALVGTLVAGIADATTVAAPPTTVLWSQDGALARGADTVALNAAVAWARFDGLAARRLASTVSARARWQTRVRTRPAACEVEDRGTGCRKNQGCHPPTLGHSLPPSGSGNE